MAEDLYYVCDLRPEWRKKPCVTFWRPLSAGYAYPLPWSGKYTLAELAVEPAYFWKRPYGKPKGAYLRFPVPCSTVDALGAVPTPKLVDGDVGPIVWQTPQIVRALRAAMLPVPESPQESEGARHD
jgi:hypothetical protein